MTVTVTDLRTLIDEADAITGWTTGATVSVFTTEPSPLEADGHLGVVVNKTSTYLEHTHGSSIDGTEPGVLVYVWVLVASFPLTTANGGLGVVIGDGTNLVGYHLAGSDKKGFSHDSGSPYYQCLLLDTSTLPTGQTVWIGADSIAMNALTQFGFECDNGTAKALGGVANYFCDILRVGNEGLRIVGGTTAGAAGTFAEIAAEDASNADLKAHGIIRALSTGVYGVQGPLTFGDSGGSANQFFQDDGAVVVFEDRDIADDKYFILVEGGSGTDSFILSNSTIQSAGPQVLTNFNGGDITTLTLTNVAFNSLGKTITFSNAADASGHTVSDCTFFQCGQVDPGDVTMTGCTFQTSGSYGDNGALLLDADGTGNLSLLAFVFETEGHGIEITAAGEYTFTGGYSFTGFAGSDGDTGDEAVYNNSGGAVVINVPTGDSPTIRNSTGSSTSIVASKTMDYHVEDADGNNVEFAQVYIQKTTPTAQFSGAGNAAGNGAIVVSSTVDADISTGGGGVPGWVIVYDKSENATLPYRYTSVSLSTLTFPTSATGTTTDQGTSTQLLDSGADFGGVDDIEEGDTIRNTTDGSWAVVDQIISTTELSTSLLRGGTNNVWGTGGDPTHDYSVHDLATTLVENVDTVDIPLVNKQTNSSGNIPQISFNLGADIPVTIRVRSNEGAAKYIPFVTAATIDDNFSGTAVIQEDTVAT